jgi:hypothetical protein
MLREPPWQTQNEMLGKLKKIKAGTFRWPALQRRKVRLYCLFFTALF